MITILNGIIESFLDSLNVQPTVAYGFMFPPEIDKATIVQMVKDKLFPTLAGLAPATTYFILLSLARVVLNHFVFKPLACYAMKVKEIPFQKAKEIDSEFPLKLKTIDRSKLKIFCSRTGRTEASVNKYFVDRKKHNVTRNKIVKFCEAFWRALFYATFCILGYNALFVPEPVSWVKDTHNYWIGWPLHPLSSTINFYYQIELGCYLHQLFWTEVKRSDALEMILHHFVTILLITISFLTNYTRIGSNILLIHDISDVFLETAKVFNYASKAPGSTKAFFKTACDITFTTFAITFFVTRLMIYPRYVLYATIVEGVEHFGCEFGGCYVFIGLLSTLQILHIYWFYLISRMLYRIVTTGIEKDERSDDEEEEAVEDHKQD